MVCLSKQPVNVKTNPWIVPTMSLGLRHTNGDISYRKNDPNLAGDLADGGATT